MAAVGLSNIAVGMFRGFVVSDSASRGAAATGAGGRTPMVSLIAAGLILLTGVFLTASTWPRSATVRDPHRTTDSRRALTVHLISPDCRWRHHGTGRL